MAIDAVPLGKAPPGRWKAPPGRLRFGAATMGLATAFPVVACGPQHDNSAGPAEAGPCSAHAVVDAVPPGGAAAVREQDAKAPGLGLPCFGGSTWAPPVTTKGRPEKSCRRMPRHQTPEERLT
jgi:hypothetical protein